MLRRLAIPAAVAFFAAVSATAVIAQDDVVKERQTLFKEWGSGTRSVAGMLRGSTPFDLAAVQALLDSYVKNAKALPGLFPEGSGPGPNTQALAAIWNDKPAFDALFAKLESDAQAARASITDEASFKATFPGVISTCGTCHDTYRQKN